MVSTLNNHTNLFLLDCVTDQQDEGCCISGFVSADLFGIYQIIVQ